MTTTLTAQPLEDPPQRTLESDRAGSVIVVALKLSPGIRDYAEAICKILGERAILLSEKHIPVDASNVIPITRSHPYSAMALGALDPRTYQAAYRALRRHNPEVLYLAGVHPANILIARLARLLPKPPRVISHIHDPVPHSRSRFTRTIWATQHLQVKLSDKILVSGQQLKVDVVNLYGIAPSRVELINLPVNRPNESQVPNSERRRISLLGRIHHYKGVDTFLDGTELALRRGRANHFRITLAGAGDLRPYESKITALRPHIDVRNHYLSPSELDTLLSESYCLVLPYHDGTQSGLIPLSLHTGTPVVVSNVGSLPENIAPMKMGFVIPPRDPSALADAIERCVDSKALTRMQRECRRGYQRLFSTCAFRERLLNEILG